MLETLLSKTDMEKDDIQLILSYESKHSNLPSELAALLALRDYAVELNNSLNKLKRELGQSEVSLPNIEIAHSGQVLVTDKKLWEMSREEYLDGVGIILIKNLTSEQLAKVSEVSKMSVSMLKTIPDSGVNKLTWSLIGDEFEDNLKYVQKAIADGKKIEKYILDEFNLKPTIMNPIAKKKVIADAALNTTSQPFESGGKQYRLVIKPERGKKIVYVERKFDEKSPWEGVPSGWDINQIRDMEIVSGRVRLMIDGGQNWYVDVPDRIWKAFIKDNVLDSLSLLDSETVFTRVGEWKFPWEMSNENYVSTSGTSQYPYKLKLEQEKKMYAELGLKLYSISQYELMVKYAKLKKWKAYGDSAITHDALSVAVANNEKGLPEIIIKGQGETEADLFAILRKDLWKHALTSGKTATGYSLVIKGLKLDEVAKKVESAKERVADGVSVSVGGSIESMVVKKKVQDGSSMSGKLGNMRVWRSDKVGLLVIEKGDANAELARENYEAFKEIAAGTKTTYTNKAKPVMTIKKVGPKVEITTEEEGYGTVVLNPEEIAFVIETGDNMKTLASERDFDGLGQLDDSIQADYVMLREQIAAILQRIKEWRDLTKDADAADVLAQVLKTKYGANIKIG